MSGVADDTCIVRKRDWLGRIKATVICGRATVEQYLRQGYAFDWKATDEARMGRR